MADKEPNQFKKWRDLNQDISYADMARKSGIAVYTMWKWYAQVKSPHDIYKKAFMRAYPEGPWPEVMIRRARVKAGAEAGEPDISPDLDGY
jgi:hypothetical protein